MTERAVSGEEKAPPLGLDDAHSSPDQQWYDRNAWWFYHPIFRSQYLYHGLLLLLLCIATPIYYTGPPEAMYSGGFDFRIDIYHETFTSKEFTALVVAITALTSTSFCYFVQFTVQIVSRRNKIKPFFARYSENSLGRVYAYAQLDLITLWIVIAILYFSVLSVAIVTFDCASEEDPLKNCSQWYQFDYILRLIITVGTSNTQVLRIYLCPKIYGDILYFTAFIIRESFFWWWPSIGFAASASLISFVGLVEIRYQFNWYYIAQRVESQNLMKREMEAEIEMLLYRVKENKKREQLISGTASPVSGMDTKDAAVIKLPRVNLGRIDEEEHIVTDIVTPPLTDPVRNDFYSSGVRSSLPKSRATQSVGSGVGGGVGGSDEGVVQDDGERIDVSDATENYQYSSPYFILSLVWTIISGDHYGTTSIKLYSHGFLNAQNEALCKFFDLISMFFSLSRIPYLYLVYNNGIQLHRYANVRIRVAFCFLVLVGAAWVSRFMIERILVRLERHVWEVEEENRSMRMSLDMLLPPEVIDNMIHSVNNESKSKRSHEKLSADDFADPIVTSEFILYRIPAGQEDEIAPTGEPSSVIQSSRGISLNSESQSDNAFYSGSGSASESEYSEPSNESWVKRVNF